MTVTYQWSVECQVTYTDGVSEVLSRQDCDSFAEAVAASKDAPKPHQDGSTKNVVLLVRDDENSRTWAFLGDDGSLDDFFTDALGKRAEPVPQRFHQEASSS